MGQYWRAVNLDKKECIGHYMLGAGAKLGEQLDTHVGTALIILTAAMPQHRGGGDLDLNTNYYGPERTDQPGSADVVDEYNEIAKRTIGRWAGNRIAMVGDYAENSDLAPEHEASKIYDLCSNDVWTDVTEDVSAVIEHECGGKFVGTWWRDFVSVRN